MASKALSAADRVNLQPHCRFSEPEFPFTCSTFAGLRGVM
eukprot:CAMPEP_0171553908 /NCGR_PEP_ID=MMETSP0960-20121227/9212_1 /TAXON_ID=87120 /ORGANISM="Aurantiochytrium limacinum, Strain ATCCMYA-1381" /LENGTH=39 /DNA_ID= /DNA_START= /DNA_END= /DNA_ORIENTATION=